MEPTTQITSSTTKHTLYLPIIAGVALIGALVGFVAGQMTASQALNEEGAGIATPGNDAYAAGYEAARQKLIARGIISNASPVSEEMLAQMTQFGGTFSGLSGDVLSVTTPFMDPLADDTVRTVLLTQDTTIVLVEMKDQEVVSKEMETYTKQMNSYVPEGDDMASFPTPPSPYNELPADRSVLTDGAMLDVTTAEMLNSPTLTATYIRVTPAPPAPVVPTIPPMELDLVNDSAGEAALNATGDIETY